MLRPVSSQVPNVPVATFARTLSVERPSQAYSQSWIVPAPLVARCVSQPSLHHPLEDRRGAVAQQVGAVDQHHAGPAARAPRGSCAAHVVDLPSRPSGQRRRGRVGVDQDVLDAGQAVALGQRAGPSAGSRSRGVVFIVPGSASSRGVGVAEVGDDDVGADARAAARVSTRPCGRSRCSPRRWPRRRPGRRPPWCSRSRRSRRRRRASARRVISFSRRIRSMTIFLENVL